MSGIDESLEFVPVSIAVVTVSDTRTLETDTSGAALVSMLEAAGHRGAGRHIVADDLDELQALVNGLVDDPDVDVVITTGGTGLTGRDITVEALRPLFDKEIDGFSVLFHRVSYESVGLSTMQSRATAGLARGTVIFALPGSTGAVKDGWNGVISGQLDSRHRPCNLVELMPRFTER